MGPVFNITGGEGGGGGWDRDVGAYRGQHLTMVEETRVDSAVGFGMGIGPTFRECPPHNVRVSMCARVIASILSCKLGLRPLHNPSFGMLRTDRIRGSTAVDVPSKRGSCCWSMDLARLTHEYRNVRAGMMQLTLFLPKPCLGSYTVPLSKKRGLEQSVVEVYTPLVPITAKASVRHLSKENSASRYIRPSHKHIHNKRRTQSRTNITEEKKKSLQYLV